MSTSLVEAPQESSADPRWSDAARAEYERLLEREIALIRARYRDYRLPALASMR